MSVEYELLLRQRFEQLKTHRVREMKIRTYAAGGRAACRVSGAAAVGSAGPN